MIVSRFMKWLLCLNVFIWCVISIMRDFDPATAIGPMWIAVLVGLCKAFVASQVCIIVAVQPEAKI
jgi:hypothetical protein